MKIMWTNNDECQVSLPSTISLSMTGFPSVKWGQWHLTTLWDCHVELAIRWCAWLYTQNSHWLHTDFLVCKMKTWGSVLNYLLLIGVSLPLGVIYLLVLLSDMSNTWKREKGESFQLVIIMTWLNLTSCDTVMAQFICVYWERTLGDSY